MPIIPLPNCVSVTELEKNKSRVSIEPCYSGYGITIGNALRRVLLSSLEGAAVVAVRVEGAAHEFSTLPNVKEDVLEIVLNAKNLHVKILGDQEEIKLTVKKKGEGKVKAADITPDSNIEVLNPELVLATVSSDSAVFEMDLYVKRGRGFDPIEARGKGREEIGLIDVDAIFTPVRAVSLKNEHVRVGQMTNWDKVILDVTTDGSVTPEDAFYSAANILFEHFDFLKNYKELPKTEAVEEKEEEEIEEIATKEEVKEAVEEESKEEKKSKKKKSE